jgi:hypothetical protein
MELPSAAQLKMEMDLPNLPKLRMLTELPKCKKSTTDVCFAPAILALPSMLKELPTLAYARIDIADPSDMKSRTEALSPRRA